MVLWDPVASACGRRRVDTVRNHVKASEPTVRSFTLNWSKEAAALALDWTGRGKANIPLYHDDTQPARCIAMHASPVKINIEGHLGGQFGF